MPNNPAAPTDVTVKTISIQEFGRCSTRGDRSSSGTFSPTEWFKGENIAGSRLVPLDKVRPRSPKHEFAAEHRDRRILRRPEVSAEPHGGGKADETGL